MSFAELSAKRTALLGNLVVLSPSSSQTEMPWRTLSSIGEHMRVVSWMHDCRLTRNRAAREEWTWELGINEIVEDSHFSSPGITWYLVVNILWVQISPQNWIARLRLSGAVEKKKNCGSFAIYLSGCPVWSFFGNSSLQMVSKNHISLPLLDSVQRIKSKSYGPLNAVAKWSLEKWDKIDC